MGRGGRSSDAARGGTTTLRAQAAARRNPADLPETRKGRRGTLDIGSDTYKRKGRKLHMRKKIGKLARNPRYGNRVRWPIVDSLGRKMCIIERTGRGWEIRDPQTNRLIYLDRTPDADQIEVQGRACMKSDGLESRYCLIKFRANDRGNIKDGESITQYAFSGFIHRDALPKAIRRRVDDYRTGSGASKLTPLRRTRLKDPGFPANARFRGEDGLEGRHYSTYNAKRPYKGAQYVMVNTTGVHGGGVVRAVLREGDRFEVLDEQPRVDRNTVEGPPVRWVYGRIAGTRIHGWVPTIAR